MDKTLIRLILLTMLLTFYTTLSLGADYKVMDHAELKGIVDADSRVFMLVDARNPEEYREAHIPGAVNIPQKNFEDFLGLLPSDKSMMLVIYCNGVKCGKSKKAAKRAMELGYTNVYVYAEGMPVWEEVGYSFYKGGDYEKRIETTRISPTDLKALSDSSPATIQIVDVRDAEEFSEGHIPGAINLPLSSFASQSDVLDKKNKVVVYCNAGGRSYSAYRKLMNLGYKNIGQALFADWKEAGLPVEM